MISLHYPYLTNHKRKWDIAQRRLPGSMGNGIDKARIEKFTKKVLMDSDES